jgi:hypothetical protein
MLTTRRQFLGLTPSLALMAGGICCPNIARALATGQSELFLAACSSRYANIKYKIGIDDGWITLYNVSKNTIQDIALSFFGHTVSQNPAHPSQLVTFEKWGKRAALVDARGSRVLASAEPMEGNIFFGHAVYTQDGSLLINTEEVDKGDGGQIVYRDPLTLKVIRSISSFGMRPHEINLLPDGKTLLVVNERGQADNPATVWIDMESGQLQHKVELEGSASAKPSRSTYAYYSHLRNTFDDWVICGGEKFPVDEKGNMIFDKKVGKHGHALIAFVSPSGEVFEPDLPDELKTAMVGEALSICPLDQTGLVAVTIPYGDMCLIFDYKTQKLVQKIDAHKVLGVTTLPALLPGHERFGMSSPHGLLQADMGAGGHSDVSIYNNNFRVQGSHLNLISI